MKQRQCSLQNMTDLKGCFVYVSAKVLSLRNTVTESISRRNSVGTNLRVIRLFRCDRTDRAFFLNPRTGAAHRHCLFHALDLMREIHLSRWHCHSHLQRHNGARRHLVVVALQVQGRNSHRESLASSAGLHFSASSTSSPSINGASWH